MHVLTTPRDLSVPRFKEKMSSPYEDILWQGLSIIIIPSEETQFGERLMALLEQILCQQEASVGL